MLRTVAKAAGRAAGQAWLPRDVGAVFRRLSRISRIAEVSCDLIQAFMYQAEARRDALVQQRDALLQPAVEPRAWIHEYTRATRGAKGGSMFDGASVVAPFIKANQLRGFLSTGEKRIPAFPDIPTAAEAGLQDFVFTAWIGLFGPPGLPPEIVQRLNAALNQALQDETVRKRITGQGDEPGGGSAEALGETVRRDHARWGEVVKANNIRADS